VNGYAARVEDALMVAAVNKSANPVQVRLRSGMARATECWPLTAPSLDAKDGVQFAQSDDMDERLVPAYSAVCGNSCTDEPVQVNCTLRI
jgi:hypothetical protein